MPMSCFSCSMNMPRLSRSAMLSVCMMVARIKMGSVGRRTCNRGIVLVHPDQRGTIATACDSRMFWLHRPVYLGYTGGDLSSEEDHGRRMASPPPKQTMKERILETADKLFYL